MVRCHCPLPDTHHSDPTVQCYAETWSLGRFGILHETGLREIRQVVRELTAEFVADYQGPSPKE
jgi:hypothetical protein